MRHVLAHLFTYALVAALILGSGLFAWLRSEQLVVAREADVQPQEFLESREPTAEDWLAFGKRTYRANCQNCHTVDGSGRSMYPPVQQMAAHLGADGGREYLIDLNLYGLYTGTYGAPMPPMPELSNTEIAAVTNYILTAFAAADGAPNPSRWYRAAEVEARRGQRKSEWDVADSRPPIASARELGKGVRPRISTDAPAVPEGKEE